MKTLKTTVFVALALAAVLVVAGCTSGSGSEGGDGLHSTVPNVIGQPQAEAQTTLQDAGYTVGDVTTKPSTASEPGVVLTQEPVAGTSVPRGGEVSLVVAE